MSPDQSGYLGASEQTVEAELGEGANLLCFHGSPHSYFDVITSTTPDANLVEKLGGYSATVMAGGHTHVQMVRRYGDALLLNPGSVGLPHGRIRSREPIRIPLCAEYAVISYY